MAENPPSQYNRHPTYYETETRTCVYAVSESCLPIEREVLRHVFQVEKVLYHFPLATLKMMSPPLTAIFDIPPSAVIMDKDGNPLPAEGTEANPIILHGISSKAFDDFLSFFYKSYVNAASMNVRV
jgi:hypothetical protein